MVFTKEQLLARLQELQISFSQYEHPVVLTVEAQAKYVGNMKGALSKNLFLKDKKHRYYVVSALANTKVDMKVLSQRLGLGKGGLRMAPEEALSEILHVPLGCVTPFALVNESARCVSLLLDKGFKTEECCFFHPLSNDMSIALNARDLDKFLNSIGKFPAYVDLEANPTVGKDQPPDLASLVPSDVTVLSNPPEKKESSPGLEKNHMSANEQPVISAGPNPAKPSNASTTEKTSEPIPAKLSNASSTEKTSGTVNMAITYADTDKFVEEILEKTRTMILSEIKEEENLEKYREQLATILSNNISNRLGAELKNLATMFKNKAYTEGFKASIYSQPKRI